MRLHAGLSLGFYVRVLLLLKGISKSMDYGFSLEQQKLFLPIIKLKMIVSMVYFPITIRIRLISAMNISITS